MAAKTAESKTIPVRLSVLVHIDPANWPQEQPATVDQDAVLKGLLAAGIAEDAAKLMVTQLSTPASSAHGPSAVRTAVREHVLSLVQGDEKLKTAGATVVDADRQPKPKK
jgi:hypothetical protein